MLTEDEFGELSALQYLDRFQIEFYLKDFLSFFLAGGGRSGSTGRPGRVPAPELIGQYFEAVLRGEHVAGRGFEYVSHTALNRRAFVSHLRSGLRGVVDPCNVAVTAHDFHDLVTRLCSDFPLQIILEAAGYAENADGSKHCLLGESHPFKSLVVPGALPTPAPVPGTEAAEMAAAAAAEGRPAPENLFVLSSLQRVTEFCFVYSELIAFVQNLYQTIADDATAAASTSSAAKGETARLPRSQLVQQIREALRAATGKSPLVAGAAAPSERALIRFALRRGRRRRWSSNATSNPRLIGSDGSLLSITEAVAEMAHHFELELDPMPDEFSEDQFAVLQPVVEKVPAGDSMATSSGSGPQAQSRGGAGGAAAAAGEATPKASADKHRRSGDLRRPPVTGGQRAGR